MKHKSPDFNNPALFQNSVEIVDFIREVFGLKKDKETSLTATSPVISWELLDELKKLYKTELTYMINYNQISYAVQELLKTHSKIVTRLKTVPDEKNILFDEFIKNIAIPRASSFIPHLFFNDKDLMRRMISGENMLSTEFDRFQEMTCIDPVKMAYPESTGNDKNQKDKISKWKNGTSNPTPGSIAQFYQDLKKQNEKIIEKNRLVLSEMEFLKDRLVMYSAYSRATRGIKNKYRKEILKKSMLFYKLFMENERNYRDLSQQLIERYTKKFMRTLERINQQAEKNKSTHIKSNQLLLKPFKDPSLPLRLNDTLSLYLERLKNNQYETWHERTQYLSHSILLSCFLFQTRKFRPKNKATLNLIKNLMRDLENMTCGSFRSVIHENRNKDREGYGPFGLNNYDLTDDHYFQTEYLRSSTIPQTAARYLLFFGGDEYFDVPYIKWSKIDTFRFDFSWAEKELWNNPRSIEGFIRECTSDSSFPDYDSWLLSDEHTELSIYIMMP